MLRQSTRERARILGGMDRADRRGLTMTGVIDVGVEGGFHGGIALGDALAELQAQALSLSLGWGAFDGGASTRCINHAVSRARALAELNRCVGACSMQPRPHVVLLESTENLRRSSCAAQQERLIGRERGRTHCSSDPTTTTKPLGSGLGSVPWP